MKKIVLVGKKLYRVGPLKLFKSSGLYGDAGRFGSTYGYGGSSGRGSSYRPGGSDYNRQVRMIEKQKEMKRKREEEEKRKKEEEKKRIEELMKNNPREFTRLLQMDNPIANELASAEENKKTEQAKKDIITEKKLKNLAKEAIPNIALDIVGLGAVNLATALASEVLSPEKKAEIVKSLEDNVPGVKAIKEAFAKEPETASDAEVEAALDSGKYDNPNNPNVYEGSKRTQTAKRESQGGDKFTPPPLLNVQAKTVVQEKVEEGPKTPAAMSEEDLTAMLEKRAKGEDSLVEREAKMARDRGLSQQLAAVRGARGATAGQRLRALQRGSETMEREIQPQVAAAKAREQQAAQDALLGMKRGDRKQAEAFAQQEKLQKLKQPQGGGGGGAPGRMGKASSFLNKVSSGINLFKKGKKLFSGLFEEGGFVSGPGTETSDSIPARLSDGEFVIKASSVRGLGKSMGAKDEKEERKKCVDFLYKLQDKMDKVEKLAEGGEIKADPERFLDFMDKGVSHGLMKKRIQKAKISKEEKEKLLKKLGKEPKFAKGGEAYVRPKKAFREAIGYEPESRFHDKAAKDAKHGGARRKFRHFQMGGPVDMKGPGMVKEQFKMPSAGGYGSVVAAQGDLQRRIEELERKMGK